MESFTESNPNYKYDALKKYFVDNIISEINDELTNLNTLDIDFNQYQLQYLDIAQKSFLKILLAINTLAKEKIE